MLLESWYNRTGENYLAELDAHEIEEDLKIVYQRLPNRPATHWPTVLKIAAAILVFIAACLVLVLRDHVRPLNKTESITDVAPGSNKAVLTLSDGKRISLTDAAVGQLAEQPGVVIGKAVGGEIVYTLNSLEEGTGREGVGYNTIATPKGGQYRVRLPDGTKVWLNAASSLKYPVSFSAQRERRVELSGEAYFEVSKVKQQTGGEPQPFIVETAMQSVKVLGTHFNINSYADEGKTVTVLAEGSVQVAAKEVSHSAGQHKFDRTVLLAPGQQAINDAKQLSVKPADIETALGWKEGYISFRNASLERILRQASRWYNINVSYSGKVPERYFSGDIPRSSSLSVLLKTLKGIDIHFTLTEGPTGKTLTVTP